MRAPLPMSEPSMLLATWFGAGLLPKAPGTWGSLAALPFAWAFWSAGGRSLLVFATIVVFFAGWWAAERFIEASGVADPGAVVIDEVAGQWLVLTVAPPHFWTYLLGFVLFRLFDVTKPWLAGWADRTVKGGLGVMLDDVFAGLFGAVILGLAWIFWGA